MASPRLNRISSVQMFQKTAVQRQGFLRSPFEGIKEACKYDIDLFHGGKDEADDHIVGNQNNAVVKTVIQLCQLLRKLQIFLLFHQIFLQEVQVILRDARCGKLRGERLIDFAEFQDRLHGLRLHASVDQHNLGKHFQCAIGV